MVGGGVAGAAAAVAAAKGGAKVALFENSAFLPPPRSEWPALIDRPASSGETMRSALLGEGIEPHFCEQVSQVSGSLMVASAGGRRGFDSVVVSTGTGPVPATLPGNGKEGVHVLVGPECYGVLREACPGYLRAVLVGSGFTALGVAQKLLQKGIRVTAIAPRGILTSRLGPRLQELVLGAARQQELAVENRQIQKVVGVDRVEAAIVGGDVLPCDCIIVVPDRAPSLPSVPAETGRSGGVLVDSRMRTSISGLYGAGECIELPAGGLSAPPVTEPAARASGRAAGMNAAGGRILLEPVGVFTGRVFGLELATAGLGLEDARAAGYSAVEVSSGPDDGRSCSIVFEAGSSRILGIQYAGPDGPPAPELFALAVREGVRLEDFANLEHTGSNNISPVLEAASEGMRLWRRS